MRVHEIAKELDWTSKDVLAALKSKGIEAKSHMSTVDDDKAQAFLVSTRARKANASSDSGAKVSAQIVDSKKDVAKKVIKKDASSKQSSEVSSSAKPMAQAETSAKSATSQAVKKDAPSVVTSNKTSTPAAPVVSSVPEKSPAEVVQPKEVISAPAEAVVPAKKAIQIQIPITVGQLAEAFSMNPAALVKTLVGMGVFASINQVLTEQAVYDVAAHLELDVEKHSAIQKKFVASRRDQHVLRPPVVTLMGHVDHGKTSLLDAIRKSHVTDREAGKITQHIGAYAIDLPGKGKITFLDTPGHAAFTAMRARGAHVTDIVVLVVAADDGIMPQTREAIDHAKAANVPIIVAINKVDLPAADVMRIKKELQRYDLMTEDWGGKTICVEVSAKEGTGIDNLLEMLLLEAEMLELQANANGLAEGTILEAKLVPGHGPEATILVQSGTMHVGDTILCGEHYGRVRALHDDWGVAMKSAAPSMAVAVLGLSGVPFAGDHFIVTDEKTAKLRAEVEALRLRDVKLQGSVLSRHISLSGLSVEASEGKIKELKLILKADVQGSLEVLTHMIEKLSNEKIELKLIHRATGGISESDVMLAAASDAIIIGYHVKADTSAETRAEKEGVEIRYYSIIYEAQDEIRAAMVGMLDPTLKEVPLGKATVRNVFKSSKVGIISGAIVNKGKLIRNCRARLYRGAQMLHDGKISSLRRFKDDVKEVAEGYECGLSIDGYQDVRMDDVIEAYQIEKHAGLLS